jgi:type IX secretion system PorP/SprF family membrane protein
MASLGMQAQDIQFTQFYANPIYMNPAYTGATPEHRFVLNYRNQWPGITRAYSTFAASYDYNVTSIKSGIGIQVLRDKAGTSGLSTTGLMASYAYFYQVEKFKDIRMGLQIGYVSRYYDYGGLIFNDQLYTGSAVSNDALVVSKVNYFNFNAGALYTTPLFWAGFALHNLNRPNTSLIEGNNALPLKFSMHGGYRFVFERRGHALLKYFAPSVNYRHQNKFDQLDIGANFYDAPLSVGVWYRGLPVKHYKAGYSNTDALSLLFGVDMKKYDLRIGLSYDITLSRLAYKSFGAPEISVVYEIAKKSKKRRAYVSCPKF